MVPGEALAAQPFHLDSLWPALKPQPCSTNRCLSLSLSFSPHPSLAFSLEINGGNGRRKPVLLNAGEGSGCLRVTLAEERVANFNLQVIRILSKMGMMLKIINVYRALPVCLVLSRASPMVSLLSSLDPSPDVRARVGPSFQLKQLRDVR